ncbi:MAG: hypothetical protein RMJ67_08810, partial [Elusimicrobiota bacterium]|nr:hypothetical protein [Endomicrobiia bacterium]MDW8166596.1 hypothetical protein [Elusimicrobiota bacterium]
QQQDLKCQLERLILKIGSLFDKKTQKLALDKITKQERIGGSRLTIDVPIIYPYDDVIKDDIPLIITCLENNCKITRVFLNDKPIKLNNMNGYLYLDHNFLKPENTIIIYFEILRDGKLIKTTKPYVSTFNLIDKTLLNDLDKHFIESNKFKNPVEKYLYRLMSLIEFSKKYDIEFAYDIEKYSFLIKRNLNLEEYE